jgi:hypothetical protein
LAKDAQTVLAQIQRVLQRTLAPGIDMIENLATALEVRPQDLLTPYFANSIVQGSESSFTEPAAPAKKKKTP